VDQSKLGASRDRHREMHMGYDANLLLFGNPPSPMYVWKTRINQEHQNVDACNKQEQKQQERKKEVFN
jgi:hypothetical protein